MNYYSIHWLCLSLTSGYCHQDLQFLLAHKIHTKFGAIRSRKYLFQKPIYLSTLHTNSDTKTKIRKSINKKFYTIYYLFYSCNNYFQKQFQISGLRLYRFNQIKFVPNLVPCSIQKYEFLKVPIINQFYIRIVILTRNFKTFSKTSCITYTQNFQNYLKLPPYLNHAIP